MKILILEDDVLTGSMFRDELAGAGHDVTLTHDNDTAVEVLFSGDFDLIFADLMIDGETSIPVLDCARLFCPEAEIVLITGSSLFPNGELHFTNADIAHRIQKPVSPDELTAIAAHFERTAGPARLAVGA